MSRESNARVDGAITMERGRRLWSKNNFVNSASRRVGGGHSFRVAAPSSLAVRTLPAACALPAVPLPVAQCNGSSSQIFIVLSWGVGTYLV